MLEELLSPLRLPERAVGALSRVAEDLSALRAEIAMGVGSLDKTTTTLASDLRPLLADAAVMRESTSHLPEGIARLEKTVDGLGGKVERLHDGVATLHGDMRELCAHVEQMGSQLAAMHETMTGIKGEVEDVTNDLPGSGGTGAIARIRDAIGGESN